jgi:thiamine monophosphate synthase
MNPEHCDGITFAKYAREMTDIPLVAIGGISHDNLHLVKALGIDAYAMTASIQNETLLMMMISKIGE